MSFIRPKLPNVRQRPSVFDQVEKRHGLVGCGFLGLDLLKLSLCQVGVEPLGMMFQKRCDRSPVTDLQREPKVAPWIGLRIGLSGSRGFGVWLKLTEFSCFQINCEGSDDPPVLVK